MNTRNLLGGVAAFGLLAIGGTAFAQTAAELPPIPNIEGKVLTVLGPVDPSVLGRTLMHEHIFFDPQLPYPDRSPHATEAGLFTEKLTLANLAAVRAGVWNRDNDSILDFDEARDEVMAFKRGGGGTIVDATSTPLGRDPKALRRMSYATGLNIVMGGGWYQKRYHPRNIDQLTLEDMTRTIVRDIAQGADGTTVRTGIIGEIGINGNPLTPNELKSTRASARASRLTGAPMTFHVGGVGEEKFTILDVVASEGVDLSHVVMGHSNSLALDLPLARRVLARGVTIEFDWLGAIGSPGGFLGASDDIKVAQGLAQLVKEGYADRIVLAHDVCNKTQLKKFGGLGYTYIDEYFLPALKKLGVSDADIHKMMVVNPARQLRFAAPQPLVAQAGAAG
jgi:phosphotriesterase-related protein